MDFVRAVMFLLEQEALRAQDWKVREQAQKHIDALEALIREEESNLLPPAKE